MKDYHLHADDLSKLHFEINNARPYCETNLLHCFKPHRHTFYQIIWFKSSGNHYIDYETLSYDKDTIIFINKNQVHHFCSDSENDGVIIHFDDIFIAKYLPSLEKKFLYALFGGVGDRYVKLSKADTIRLAGLISLLQQEMLEKHNYFQAQVSLLFQSFLILLERFRDEAKSERIGATDPLWDIAIRFKILVNEQLSEFKSLEFYLDRLNISTKKLTLASKKYFNETPNNLIHKEKLLESKRLLLNSNLTIQEVAYSLGYDQPTYFIKVFKKFFNMTPKEFRVRIN